MTATEQALARITAAAPFRQLGGYGTDQELVVGHRYLVRVGCDSENWFEAAYLGLYEVEDKTYLRFDNGVYAQWNGCGTELYDPTQPPDPC